MKKKLSVLIVFMLIGLTACSKPAEGTNPVEKKEATITPVGKEEVSSAPGESDEIAVTRKEYGTEEVELKGKALGQMTEKGTDNPYYCNLEENLKMAFAVDNVPIYVCKDPVYDITYYVNFGRDNFIYVYRKEASVLAVAIPARDLYCKEGELYFIAETDGQYQLSGFAQGNILKYNPVDGSVAVVVDCNADKMIVYPDGICYMEIRETEKTGGVISRTEEHLFFSFTTGESSAFPKGVDSLRRWNGYWLQREEEVEILSESDPSLQTPEKQELLAKGYTFGVATGVIKELRLLDAQGNIVETLQNATGISRYNYMVGDYVYYAENRQNEEDTEERSYLIRYDKKTGTHEEIVLLGQLTDLSYEDMLIHKNAAYFEYGLRVELDTGAQCRMGYAGEGLSPQINCFYTDGESMFCLSEGKLWLFEEQPGSFVFTQELVVGVPLDIGTYEYRLVEP
ncbi:MAG: hypothetical protein J6K04_00285 [Lachnospiraceae bacterium]|nr:hypothetical protein [Lachnospiraceae bacterium]MBP3567577.1 hypothetical protein [Lachnospiraceae bacterium]